MFLDKLMERRLLIGYGIWNKLEELFMTKSLTNRIMLKEKFFGFHMDSTKNLEQNLDEFKKIAIALASINEDKIEESRDYTVKCAFRLI